MTPSSIEANNNQEFEIKEVLDLRQCQNMLEYFV